MLKLMYITNRPEIGLIAESAGVDRIFIDLEVLDKAARQAGLDTVQSHHTLHDVAVMRQFLTKAQLLVRVNHIYEGSRDEIDQAIGNGATIIMLPYFKTVNEVAKFIDLVGGRARTMLLLETKEAVEKIDAILELEGIDEIHIGLNDLHLSYGMKFMFELLADGTVDHLAAKFRAKGIPFGFGGIARLGEGAIPAERIIKEHYRVGSTRAILARSFCNTDQVRDLDEVARTFQEGVREIRALEAEAQRELDYFRINHEEVEEAVREFVK